MHTSMRLKYEPSSEPLHISATLLLCMRSIGLQRRILRAVIGAQGIGGYNPVLNDRSDFTQSRPV